MCFNPRAPCGARREDLLAFAESATFQSTRPVRGATARPRDSRRATRVSIHAPRAGRDRGGAVPRKAQVRFNPRAPCGARRGHVCTLPHRNRFNPRAPCGARPPVSTSVRQMQRSFNPRAPCGARPASASASFCIARFQSTRPVRGATLFMRLPPFVRSVSIHAPRAGRDAAPRRGVDRLGVSIHAPRAGRDPAQMCILRLVQRFNPRAPCGARRRSSRCPRFIICFNPRAPCGARLGDLE